MRLLAFSDLHVDTGQAERLVAAGEDADVVVGVGDFASVHSSAEDAYWRNQVAVCKNPPKENR